jgi:hypothetical protein
VQLEQQQRSIEISKARQAQAESEQAKAESEQAKAEAEQVRNLAEKLAAKLRTLGIDPDDL